MACPSQLNVQSGDAIRQIPVDGSGPTRRLTELLRRHELPLNTRCGQRGLCEGCLVELVQGSLEPVEAGSPVSADHQPQMVRACQYRLPAGGHATVHVPARSLLAHRPQVVTSFRVDVSRAHDPLWQMVRLRGDELPAAADTTLAVCEAIARRRDRDLPVRARHTVPPWTVAAAQAQGFALDQQGDHWSVTGMANECPTPYGLAIDVGTTTVVAMLVELASGRIVNTASALNGQTRLGDNVVTRINLCMQDKQMVRRLQHMMIKHTLRPLLEEVCTGAGSELAGGCDTRLEWDQVKCLVIAGNTTMLHLLAGADPTPLGTVPFTPEFLDHRLLRGGELAVLPKQSKRAARGDKAAHAGEPADAVEAADPAVHLLPGASAYIGADVVAGVFATGMAYRDEPCLLVDVGTNGEIVLKAGARLLGCATAAGPAFEGSGLTSGVRAGSGAIGHIRLGGEGDRFEPQIEVIGGGAPIGLCGTAYVDFLAQARARGLIGPTGRFVTAGPTERPPGRRFPIGTATDGRSIEISESDVASLLQAKAAIAAGILCLLQRLELAPNQITTLYLAGGFGFHMSVENVLRCGLLPGFRADQIELVGNTALAGAYLALMDSSALAEMKRMARRLETVELNLEPQFESLYIDNLLLPQPEAG